MFQYAATRGIAAKHGYDWCIPPGPKEDEEFNDEENQHKLFMAFKMSGVKSVNMHPAPYQQEGSFTFDQELFDTCPDNINLYGYFQSENILSILRKNSGKTLLGVTTLGIFVKIFLIALMARLFPSTFDALTTWLNQHIIQYFR